VTDIPTPRLTTDKHVSNMSDALLVGPDGLRHYAIVVDDVPKDARFDWLRDKTPFYVPMCELCDAYDIAKGWYDFEYPETKYKAEDIERGYPTCARCSGA
jgi:hypothetical protein